MLLSGERRGRLLATVLVTLIVAYIGWKIAESPSQAVQFTFNGLSVGAVYALMAMGFTLVYSTVWFFDLYYGAAAALGAYGVFYLRSQESLGGQYAVNDHSINLLFALIVASVVAWALYTAFHSRFRERYSRNVLLAAGGLLAVSAGVYTWFVLAYPENLHLAFAPAVGGATALAAYWLLHRGLQRALPSLPHLAATVPLSVIAIALGVYCGYLLTGTPESKLYLSWVVSCLLAGTVALALYRGLYVYMRRRSRSPSSCSSPLWASSFPSQPLSLLSSRAHPARCRMPWAATLGPWQGPTLRASTFSPLA